jgi:hypothetical protein
MLGDWSKVPNFLFPPSLMHLMGTGGGVAPADDDPKSSLRMRRRSKGHAEIEPAAAPDAKTAVAPPASPNAAPKTSAQGRRPRAQRESAAASSS